MDDSIEKVSEGKVNEGKKFSPRARHDQPIDQIRAISDRPSTSTSRPK